MQRGPIPTLDRSRGLTHPDAMTKSATSNRALK